MRWPSVRGTIETVPGPVTADDLRRSRLGMLLAIDGSLCSRRLGRCPGFGPCSGTGRLYTALRPPRQALAIELPQCLSRTVRARGSSRLRVAVRGWPGYGGCRRRGNARDGLLCPHHWSRYQFAIQRFNKRIIRQRRRRLGASKVVDIQSSVRGAVVHVHRRRLILLCRAFVGCIGCRVCCRRLRKGQLLWSPRIHCRRDSNVAI